MKLAWQGDDPGWVKHGRYDLDYAAKQKRPRANHHGGPRPRDTEEGYPAGGRNGLLGTSAPSRSDLTLLHLTQSGLAGEALDLAAQLGNFALEGVDLAFQFADSAGGCIFHLRQLLGRLSIGGRRPLDLPGLFSFEQSDPLFRFR